MARLSDLLPDEDRTPGRLPGLPDRGLVYGRPDLRDLVEADHEKYTHHLLVRYLVAHGLVDERSAYTNQRRHWKAGFGHPWPLVLAYRALLVGPEDGDTARRLAEEAYGLAVEARQGPTVRLIGAAIAVAGLQFGARCPLDGVLSGLREEIPEAAARIEALERARTQPQPQPALTVLAAALPFNFR